MAFDLMQVYGFGTGKLQDVEVTNLEIRDDFNSYARVTAIDKKNISIDDDNAYTGIFENFVAGTDILIHASASLGATKKLGKFICAKVVSTAGKNLTLDKNIEAVFDNTDLIDYRIQAVTFANFHSLKIQQGGIVTPQPYSPTKFYGGILAVKCNHSLELNGGHILLSDTGIPTFQKDLLRPILDQEAAGELDESDRAGEENFCDNNIFPLNSGDGAAFIFAKEIISCDTSRIGNIATHGNAFCRGAKDSIFKPSNITNIGGSSILLAYKREKNLSAFVFAKYRNSNSLEGKGLARCCVIDNLDNLVLDEKLFHNELIENSARLSRDYNIHDFGSGVYGNVENPTYRLNTYIGLRNPRDNFADIDGYLIGGLAGFKIGAKCLVFGRDGKYKVAEVLLIEESVVTFDTLLPEGSNLAIVLPEFQNLTVTDEYPHAEIFAAFVRNKCKIAGTINGRAYVFAENLEVTSSAKIGSDRAIIACKNANGLTEQNLPKNNFIFLAD